jgi:hypothetical protein
MRLEIPGYEAASQNLDRANAEVERRQRDEEAASARQAQREALRKKQQLSDGLSSRISMLISAAGAGDIKWPHEGSGSWESGWKPIAESKEGTLMAQMRRTWQAGQQSGHMGGYDYFSYHLKNYATSIELKLVATEVEGLPITALRFDNSAMDHSFGDVEAYIYPKIPLYGLDEASEEARQARELLRLVEDAFLPPNHPVIKNRE